MSVGMAGISEVGPELARGPLLCVKCRQTGHVMNQCAHIDQPADEFEWFFSEERRAMRFDGSSDTEQQELCTRCQKLDVLQLLKAEIPWKTLAKFEQAPRNGADSIRKLGEAGSVEFRDNCSLCRCLFALTPTPNSSNQLVILLPQWNMYRLTGELDVIKDTSDWEQFEKSLLVVLQPSSTNFQFFVTAHRGDALTIVKSEYEHNELTLGGRLISIDLLDESAIPLIRAWVSSCDRLHGADCRSSWTPNLRETRLIDVNLREIVKYPDHGCNYVALSYVWGGLKQYSYQLGSSFKGETLPKTIEDALLLVKRLNMHYLWIDSLCIDQKDNADKKKQIDRMWSIYSGAYLAIIALSGTSADSGLPRVRSKTSRIPQLYCRIDGERLVGLMPTLTQQIWRSPWGKRAWTLQEALASRRCLYLSDHQMYFECNGMQICESLEGAKSWAHNMRSDSHPTKPLWSLVGGGCLRNPELRPERRLFDYGGSVGLFSLRPGLAYDSDALNAFAGILEFFKTAYPEGYYIGIPLEDFQWGLLWRPRWRIKRRNNFPTWSWAGWRGAIWPGQPEADPKSLKTDSNFLPVHLHIFRASEEQPTELLPLFISHHDVCKEVGELQASLQCDAVAKAASLEPRESYFDPNMYRDAFQKSYIFIEAILFEFKPDYTQPRKKIRRMGEDELFDFWVSDVRCILKIISVDDEVTNSHEAVREKQNFLLLARDRQQGFIWHFLLLLSFVEGDLAERRTVIHLLVPEDGLRALLELNPRKRRIVLS